MDINKIVTARRRLDGDLIIVDDFLNHRVEPEIMTAIGERVADLCSIEANDLILTAEASGIAPAMATSVATGVPFIFAKKTVGPAKAGSISRPVASATKGFTYNVGVRAGLLASVDRVWIVDDFLSDGNCAVALVEMAREAGCEVAGACFVIEKTYKDGRSRLEDLGVEVSSVVAVSAADLDEVTTAQSSVAVPGR